MKSFAIPSLLALAPVISKAPAHIAPVISKAPAHIGKFEYAKKENCGPANTTLDRKEFNGEDGEETRNWFRSKVGNALGDHEVITTKGLAVVAKINDIDECKQVCESIAPLGLCQRIYYSRSKILQTHCFIGFNGEPCVREKDGYDTYELWTAPATSPAPADLTTTTTTPATFPAPADLTPATSPAPADLTPATFPAPADLTTPTNTCSACAGKIDIYPGRCKTRASKTSCKIPTGVNAYWWTAENCKKTCCGIRSCGGKKK